MPAVGVQGKTVKGQHVEKGTKVERRKVSREVVLNVMLSDPVLYSMSSGCVLRVADALSPPILVLRIFHIR